MATLVKCARPGRTMSDVLHENKCLKERVRQLEEQVYQLVMAERESRAVLSIPSVAVAKKQLDDVVCHFERVVRRATHSA